MIKSLAVLGSTGSIGVQALEVARLHNLKIEALTAGSRIDILENQIREFSPAVAAVADENAAKELRIKVADTPTKILSGADGVKECAACGAESVLNSIVGIAGLAPTVAAIEAGSDIALANKETLVAGGDLVRKAQQKSGAKILPVDSEHSAIFQCIEPDSKCLNKILLTASGGPFRTWDKEALYQVTPAQALKHPNWSMGQKITIDSATLMNKGLEVIEANWLFGVDYDNIQVLVHPQSIIHSMVEYGDGTVLAHLGKADMRIPIQYALTWPERQGNPFPKLDFTQLAGLEFFHPDYDKFPALALAFQAGRTGKSAPAVLNGANEVAVAAFLKEQIGFMDIPALVQSVVEAHEPVEAESFAHLLEIDRWARQQAELFVKKHGR